MIYKPGGKLIIGESENSTNDMDSLCSDNESSRQNETNTDSEFSSSPVTLNLSPIKQTNELN